MKKATLARKTVNRIIVALTMISIVFLFVYLNIGETRLKGLDQLGEGQIEFLADWQLEDGTNISIPQNVSGREKGEPITITRHMGTYPDSYDNLLLWCKGEDIEVFCDGKSIYKFDNDSVPKFGIDTVYLYLFVQLPENVSGKDLSITYTPILSKDKGAVGDVFIGNKTALLIDIVKDYQLEIFLAFFVILLGIICLVVSIAFFATTKVNISIPYLGMAVVVSAFWLLANSIARQFVFPNVAAIRDCAFFALPIMAIPFALYVDKMQKERYHILFLSLEILGLVDLVYIFIMHILSIAPLSENRLGSLFVLGATIISIIATIIVDIFKGHIKNYKAAAIGMGCFLLGAIIQFVMDPILNLTEISGAVFSVGLILLIVFSLLESVFFIGRMDSEKDNAIKQVEHLSRSSMEALAKTVDAKDRYTAGHSQRVAEYACLIAKELGWSQEKIDELRFQGLMHDIGKIGVPDNVLNKPGRLSDIEFEIIQSHTIVGDNILKNFTALSNVSSVARYHHERYDGKGYPDHLKGEEIPLAARIVGIADSFDAMNSDRVYRKALPLDVIMAEIRKGIGTQFDPDLAEVFLKMLEEDRVHVASEKNDLVERRLDEFDSSEFEEDVNSIMTRIKEEGEYEGALSVDVDQFSKLIEYMSNLESRYGHPFEVVSISLNSKGDEFVTKEQLKAANECMEHSIRKSIRNVDICTKYSDTQYLAILFEIDAESINIVIQRIFMDFYKICDASHFDVSYSIADISKSE